MIWQCSVRQSFDNSNLIVGCPTQIVIGFCRRCSWRRIASCLLNLYLEISSWEEVNELVETYHVPTVEEIIDNVAVGTVMDDSESEDEQLQGESECDDDVLEVGAAVVEVSEPC